MKTKISIFLLICLVALDVQSQKISALPTYTTGSPVYFPVAVGSSPTTRKTTLKTINGTSILGTGNITISSGTSINLTTTGTSGAATLIGSTLNIPNYASGGGGGTTTQYDNAFLLKENLKWIEFYKQKVDDGTGQFNITFLGDSKTEMQTVPRLLTEILGTKVKVDGQGYIPLNSDQTTLYNAISVGASSWTLKDQTSGGRNLAVYSRVSNGGSQPLGWTINAGTNKEWNKFTNLDVGYYGASGGGTFTVHVDGVLKATVNTSTLTGVQKVSITGLTDEPHAVSITPTSVNCELLYIKPWRDNIYRRGYIVNAIGHSGFQASNYLTALNADWNTQFTQLNSHLVAIYLGTNERHNNVAPSTFKTNMKALVAHIKGLNPSADIVLWTQVDCDASNPYFATSTHSAEAYNEKLREIAAEDNVAVFDVYKLAEEYAVNNTKPWLSDGIHESEFGAYAEAVNFWEGLPSIATSSNAAQDLNNKFGIKIEDLGSSGNRVKLTELIASNNLETNAFKANTAEIAGTTIMQEPAGAVLEAGATIDVTAFQKNLNVLASINGGVKDNFYFGNWYAKVGLALNRAWNQSSSIMRIALGWGDPNQGNINANTLHINGELNMPSAVSTNKVRGLFYNPTITNLGSAKHIAIETTSGAIIYGDCPVYADNTAAAALATGTIYRTSTGDLKIKY